MNINIKQKRREDDRNHLYDQPEFRRFLFDIVDASAIARISREEQQSLLLEGKRSLGLEILAWFSSNNSEPFDVISASIEAQAQLSKGTHND